MNLINAGTAKSLGIPGLEKAPGGGVLGLPVTE